MTLIFVENCSPETLNERERLHIRDRGMLNGARLPRGSITPPIAAKANEPKGQVGMVDDKMRAVAKRLAFYQRLVSNFETSLTALDGNDGGRPMADEFFSDIIYLMSLQDDDDLSVFETLASLINDERDKVLTILEQKAREAGVAL